jgi:hypothetical protein
MTLAAVLLLYFLGLASPAEVRGLAAQDQGIAPAAQSQSPAAQGANPTPTPASPSQPQHSSQAQPSPKRPARHKKIGAADCSNSATATASANAGSTDAGSASAKPCPPPKVVIKNGGSDEPVVQLKGDTTAEKASQERSTTEQLTAATEENLKKIAGRPLSPSQQEMVNQVKQFTAQSKEAIAAGDLERGHNLAVKARLLSDELVKP